MPDSVSSIVFQDSIAEDFAFAANDSLAEATDRKLFKLLRKGDRQAFHELFSRYETRLLAYAEKYLNGGSLAQDVVQEVFLKLINKPPKVMFSDSLAPWLFRVTRNLAIDKRRGRKFEISDEDAGVNDMAADQTPYQHVCHQSELELFEKLVEELPQSLKDVVLLRMRGEVPFREIATILSIPQGTALWRMHRAMQLLRERWNQHVEEM
mgnify:CR=1 FL=1